MVLFYLCLALSASVLADVLLRGDLFDQEKYLNGLYNCRRYGVKLSLTDKGELAYVIDSEVYTRRIDFDALDDGSKELSLSFLRKAQKEADAGDAGKAAERVDRILDEDEFKRISMVAKRRAQTLTTSYHLMRTMVKAMLGPSVLLLGLDSNAMLGGEKRRAGLYLHGSFCTPTDAPIDGALEDPEVLPGPQTPVADNNGATVRDVSQSCSGTIPVADSDGFLPDGLPQWIHETISNSDAATSLGTSHF